ncbi:MAG: hypothetical protein JWO68_2331, partial [Actinomycetia bacterium]|nr:hypothetical protein [Actinomycetes bacterium]
APATAPGPSVTVPCPAGVPTLQVLGLTPGTDGTLIVSGEADNPSSVAVAIAGFTLRATVGGQDIAVPAAVQQLVVPANGSVAWEAAVPAAATQVGASLGQWSWRDPGLSSRCPSS